MNLLTTSERRREARDLAIRAIQEGNEGRFHINPRVVVSLADDLVTLQAELANCRMVLRAYQEAWDNVTADPDDAE